MTVDGAIMRVFLDRLYLFSGYLAGLFMVATSFLGLAHTFRSGEMIRVGLLIDRFEGRTRHWIELAALVIGCGFVAFFAWHATRMTIDSWRFNDMAQGVLAVPLWIPQFGYAGGLIILLIAFLDEFVHVVLRGQPPRYEKPPAQSDEEIVERAMASGV
jgi:TRAP-type C4-dicarboxylate transport system permease small subunit